MPYQQLTLETRDGIAVLTFRSGKVNAMSPEFLAEAREALKAVTQASETRALILTGGESRFFSFGLDVARLLSFERAPMTLFLKDLNQLLETLYLFPKPVVAAVNGHAMAGGLLMALCADTRIGVEGDFSIGLSEVQLGIAAPAASLRILARRVGEARAREIAMTGTVYKPEGAREMGLLDELVPPDNLVARARERAETLAALPPEGVALNKRYLGAGIFDGDPETFRRESETWLDAWFSRESREKLRALVERK